MKKFFLTTAFFVMAPIAFLFALIFILLLYRQNALNDYYFLKGRTVAYAALPNIQNILGASISQEDGRVERIRQFLAQYGSPLEPYAKDIVDSADQYGLDFRLITAIAMQESNLCKVSPPESNNCWGFGIYGQHVTRFRDYKDAIHTVTKSLATKYKNRGLVTPEQIMTMYTPSSNGSWAFSVNHFMDILQ